MTKYNYRNSHLQWLVNKLLFVGYCIVVIVVIIVVVIIFCLSVCVARNWSHSVIIVHSNEKMICAVINWYFLWSCWYALKHLRASTSSVIFILSLCHISLQCHVVGSRLAYVTIKIRSQRIITATQHRDFRQNHSQAIGHCHFLQLHTLMPHHLLQCSSSTTVRASETIFCLTPYFLSFQVSSSCCCYAR